MANAIVTLTIMPESPEIDLSGLITEIKNLIVEFAGEGDMKEAIEPIAFGLKALKIMFVMNEDLGSTEALEGRITQIEGINSVEVTDMRRAVG